MCRAHVCDFLESHLCCRLQQEKNEKIIILFYSHFQIANNIINKKKSKK
jgi:hypothetical protein